MAGSWAETTLAQRSIPGVVAKLVESSYRRGGEATRLDRSIEVRLRLSPSKSPLKAGRQGGALNSIGKLMLIPANAPTRAVSEVEQNIRCLSLKIDPEWITETLHVDGTAISGDVLLDMNFSNDQVRLAMQRISSEVASQNSLSGVVIDACCRLISAELIRKCDSSAHSVESIRDIVVEQRIREIENYIYEFGDGCPTLSDIARELNLGVGYVRQFYKAATNRTLFDVIQEVRIARAQALLADKKLPLKIISYKLGFCTPSAFTVAFRKATGTTPREYRARAGSAQGDWEGAAGHLI